MSHPRQRDTLLEFLRANADDRGIVRMTTVEISERLKSGFDPHDVAKTAQDLKQNGFIKARVKKYGSGTRGRTRQELFDIKLLPRALVKEEMLLAASETVLITDAGGYRRRGTLVKVLEGGKAQIKDQAGHIRVGLVLAEALPATNEPEFVAWPTRGVNIRRQPWYSRLGTGAERAAKFDTSPKLRIRSGQQYRFIAVLPNTKPNQEGIVYGWDKKGTLFYGTLAPVSPEKGEMQTKVEERVVESQAPVAPESTPTPEKLLPRPTPIEIVDVPTPTIDIKRWPMIAQLLTRESDVLTAVENLERIGRSDLVGQILTDEQARLNTTAGQIEGQFLSFIRELGNIVNIET